MALTPRVLLFGRNVDTFCGTIAIARRSKHYNPKFRWLRKMKYIHPGIEFDKQITNEDKTRRMKELGVFPARRSEEVPLYIQSSLEIFDPYVPQPGDGQYTSLRTKVASALSVRESALKKGRNLIALRKLRKFIANFDEDQFAQTGLDIYIKAHTALVSGDVVELERYATDNAICLMMRNVQNKTLKWKYIESLDPPKTVHIRTASVGSKENLFGQITVRIHSKQVLAIYDRFGRLMYGSEILAKDVLEFAVFEVHLTNMNGAFKLHHKIIPDWMEPKYSIEKTYHKPKDEEKAEDLGDEYQLISEAEEQEEKKLQQ